MSAADIARSLGGAARGATGWWQAKCPAHTDGKASLGLHDTEDGGVAWKCMAGCDSKSVAAALAARDLLPERPTGRRSAEQGRRIIATYDYPDATGKVVFQVVRYAPKDFRQRRPDPGKPDGWVWSLGDLTRPLYRLPELLAADIAAPVHLVEGEKAADRLRALGLVATTTAQGAQGWPKSDH